MQLTNHEYTLFRGIGTAGILINISQIHIDWENNFIYILLFIIWNIDVWSICRIQKQLMHNAYLHFKPRNCGMVCSAKNGLNIWSLITMTFDTYILTYLYVTLASITRAAYSNNKRQKGSGDPNVYHACLVNQKFLLTLLNAWNG